MRLNGFIRLLCARLRTGAVYLSKFFGRNMRKFGHQRDYAFDKEPSILYNTNRGNDELFVF